MHHIHATEYGWDHQPYWAYLEKMKGVMPEKAFAFASNGENHDLTSPNSLHDAWLERWDLIEAGGSEDRQQRRVRVEACFLGPHHDRFIRLIYRNVSSYSLGSGALGRRGHHDLLVHEFVLLDDGRLSHEFVFADGAVFSVQFTEFDHRIDLFRQEP